MSKSNSIVTDINRLLVYCDYKFHTRKVSVLVCFKALEYDAARFGITIEEFLEIIATTDNIVEDVDIYD